MHHVFVYGTLRQGEANHHLLADSACIALSARTSGWLVDTGCGYPALLQSSDDWVYGELYEVDDRTLRRLDHLEEFYGVGDSRNLYERVEARVEKKQGAVQAWTYIFTEERDCRRISEGDWKLYRLRQQPEELK